jgi:DNA-binding NtrC family response regulator
VCDGAATLSTLAIIVSPIQSTGLLIHTFKMMIGTGFAVLLANEVRRPPTMKPRILVVDDDEAITQQLYWTLCDEYDVVTANDMQTAIRRATFYKPDISILDLQLPPAADSPEIGLRLLEYVKGHLPESRVVIMSSNDGPDIQKTCYAAGADGFFDKPFEIEEMLASIYQLTPVHKMELIFDLH